VTDELSTSTLPRHSGAMATESTRLVIDASETSSIDHGGVRPRRPRRSEWTSIAAFLVVLGMVLTVAGGLASDEHALLGRIGKWAFGGRVRPEVTFTLDASWIDPRVRQANPDFFTSPLSEAYVVRHNYRSHLFFLDKDKIKMTRIGLRKWTLTTSMVNYEYGFALGNEAGAILREIGPSVNTKKHGPESASKFMDACTVNFWPYRNRLIPQINYGSASLNISACFAACSTSCELPDAPAPLASLDASQYSGGTTWGNSQIECNLGSETTYDSTMNGMYINGNKASIITCPYEIGPARYPQLTIEVVFRLDPSYDPTASYGWIFGHDNGGFDRSFIISDPRFGGGIGSGIGSAYNSGAPTPTKGVWHHGLSVFRQGVIDGSYTALDGNISSNKATANNNEGKSSFTVGGLAGTQAVPHEMKGWIRYFNFYDGALDENQVEALYVQNTPWP
jgi:hypothetical protein